MTRLFKFVAAAAPLLAATLAFGEISGSKHDFSQYSWSDNQICKPCHTPHNADVSLTGRLWAHTLSTATYKYHGGTVSGFKDGSTSQEAGTGTAAQTDMDYATRLCLSCHDGTIALDSFMGKDGTSDGKKIGDADGQHGSVNANLGGGGATPDLTNDHPVGYKAHVDDTVYSTLPDGTKDYRYNPVSSIKTKLKLATSPDVYPAGTVDRTGTSVAGTNYASVSCVTCHNVHNAGAPDEAGLLRMSNVGSAMCLTCHNK